MMNTIDDVNYGLRREQASGFVSRLVLWWNSETANVEVVGELVNERQAHGDEVGKNQGKVDLQPNNSIEIRFK